MSNFVRDAIQIPHCDCVIVIVTVRQVIGEWRRHNSQAWRQSCWVASVIGMMWHCADSNILCGVDVCRAVGGWNWWRLVYQLLFTTLFTLSRACSCRKCFTHSTWCCAHHFV